MKITPNKEICRICKYGDGKWQERIGQKMPDLPVCTKCQEDGWTTDPTEIMNAIQKDPLLNGKIGLSINPDDIK